MKPVSRKIHFFRVKLSTYSDGAFIPVTDPIDISKQIFSNIEQLPYILVKDQPSRYLETWDENVLYIQTDTKDIVKSETIDAQFAISRRNLLPVIEEKGKLTDLSIPPNAGVAEITHFVYFLKDAIMGVEFNFYGPRATRIGFYIQDKTSLISQFILTPILSKDITATLDKIDEISLFRIQAHVSAGETIAQLNTDLGAAFKASYNIDNLDTIEITLRKKNYSKKGLKLPFTNKKITDILDDPEKRESFNQFGVKAYDNEYNRERYFDFLEDKYIFTKKVIRQNERSRSINSISMYSAIKEAYDEHRKELIIG